MLRNDMPFLCKCWHDNLVYNIGMKETLKRAINIGSVDNLIKRIRQNKFSKRNTYRFFIEFYHDFQELTEKESIFNNEYNIIKDSNLCVNGIFRIIGNDVQIKALIIASRFIKKGNILLVK